MIIDTSRLIEGEYYWVLDTTPFVFHHLGERVEEPSNRKPEIMQWWGDHFASMGTDLYWWDYEMRPLKVLAHIPMLEGK